MSFRRGTDGLYYHTATPTQRYAKQQEAIRAYRTRTNPPPAADRPPYTTAPLRVRRDGRVHIVLELPHDHTDASDLVNPASHQLNGFGIDHNPTTWKIQLANRWVEHVKVDPEGNQYDLEQVYMFRSLPQKYLFMSSVVPPEGIAAGLVPEYQAMAKRWVNGHYALYIWKGFDGFFPHFVWLMERTPGECRCAHCVPENAGV